MGFMFTIGSKKVASAITPTVLNPEMWNRFWVSWDKGKIEIGKSRYIGSNLLLSYKVILMLSII